MSFAGGTALAALDVLLHCGVREDRLIFVNLISSPEGITAVCQRYPNLKIVTSSVERCLDESAYMLPGIDDFGDRYFSTDR